LKDIRTAKLNKEDLVDDKNANTIKIKMVEAFKLFFKYKIMISLSIRIFLKNAKLKFLKTIDLQSLLKASTVEAA